ncbi:D-alanyl-D-alanine carboxypeptidase family protein [Erythrobacter ani]|uniref:D-alanyl-D-alanine carboxypeptidase n=1 Tax=Erythrobacter ani TaxID=2827235 RepID=A0ABS6SPT9_9SPHN|nr:D-alanyl-D-alanine carboxypeptidase family protein [Erythrobacter ani]MBV7267056.1 D-alanyl-D-alanine carboxypeptidase [Erythrobacter ani]
MAQSAAQIGPASPEDAPIALLLDMSSGQILHARNPDRRFIPASITKAMTIFLAFELIEEGRLDPRQVITLNPDSWREWSMKGSTMFLPADARVTVDDLIAGIANVSANDGSIALAEAYSGSVAEWTAAMNAKAREIGMKDSHFGTPNGWPDEGRTFTTASDLAKLAEAMIRRHPDKFARYVGRQQFTYNGITQRNHDPLLGRVRGADGIKTGFTNESGYGFLGTVQRGQQRLVLVIAGSPRSSLRARAARQYVEWGFEAFDQTLLYGADTVIDHVKVQGGSMRQLGVIVGREIFVNAPSGQASNPDIRTIYDGPLRAPIKAGDKVATLEIKVAGMDTARIPLLARENVDEAGFFARIFNGIAGWFS